MLHEITPMILTFNEEANIGRTLAKLTWAKKILIIDSGSTDRTLEIASQYPQVGGHSARFRYRGAPVQLRSDAISTANGFSRWMPTMF